MANEKSKSVKMSASKGNVKNPGQEKLSYEQLEQIAGNLNQQCRQMQQVINNQQQAIAEFNEIGNQYKFNFSNMTHPTNQPWRKHRLERG